MNELRTRTTPETFEADFMATPFQRPGGYPEHYFVPIRRKYLHAVQTVLQLHDPRLLGGPILRMMVEAGEISFAEAVEDIHNQAEAIPHWDASCAADPIAAPIWEAILASNDGGDPTPEQEAEEDRLQKALEARQREMTIEHLREQGEHAIADMAEDWPNTLALIIKSARRTGKRIVPMEDYDAA